MSDSTLLLQAIRSKKLITFEYQGLPRTCEPHIYGICNGIPQVLCYQLSGGSSRDALPEWRRFDLGGIFNLDLSQEHFPGLRRVPHPHSLGWDQLIAVVR